MIVNRRMFIARKGHYEEAVAFAKKALAELAPNVRARVYHDNISPFDLFGWDVEYDSLAAYERAMQDYGARLNPEWWAQWNALTETGGTNEIWTLA
jgi:hypothetical protein